MSFLTDEPLATAAGDKTQKQYAPSDIPGFVHPVMDGKPMAGIYIAETDTESDNPVQLTKAEAKSAATAGVMYGKK
jgi:hypothetical protein